MVATRDQPRVSVVMTVFDGDAYLQTALDSVLAQTFTDLELIVVDDGSADRSAEILAEAAARDPRIVVLTNPTNRGQTASLNRALAVARGTLIARQDADDLSAPERLLRQVTYFDGQPEVGLLGTAYHEIDAAGRPLATHYPPASDTGIRAQMLFHNALCHTAVMVRQTALDREPQGYDESLAFSQDVDLWTRLMRHTQAANLQAPLVSLRKHAQNVSVRHAQRQQHIATAIARRQIHELAPSLRLSEPQVQSLRDWYGGASSQIPGARLHLCQVYFDLLDSLARRPDADAAVIAQHRRYHIRTLLGQVTTAQLPGLVTSGVLWRMITADPVATAQAVRARLARRVHTALGGEGAVR